MIITFPDTVFGRIGAVLSALIIISCLIGLTMSREVYEGQPRKDFFFYFTNLSNLLVLIYFALLAPVFYARSALRRFIPFTEFSVTMCIALTYAVFHTLILPRVQVYTQHAHSGKELRIMAVNTLFVHYIVPWLTIAYWVLCSPGKQRIPLHAALVWLAFPCAYAACIFLRAQSGKCIPGLKTPYPYPFLNTALYGARRVALHCAALFVVSALASTLLLLIVRQLPV